MASKEITVPDIGDFKDVDIIEVHVAAGDTVAEEDPLITLESDKASMDIPAPEAGTVKEVKVKVGDKVSEGGLILLLEAGGGAAAADDAPAPKPSAPEEQERAAAPSSGGVEEVRVPDIGDFKGVDVIEIHVAPGGKVAEEDPLITLESDKASMDIPSPAAGTVKEVKIQVGDKVSEGDLIALLETSGASAGATPGAPEPAAESAPKAPPAAAPEAPAAPREPPAVAPTKVDEEAFAKVHASPSVRRFARELGVDLGKVQGSGRKGRVTKEDVQGFVKQVMSGAAAPAAASAEGGAGIPPIPPVDFAKFGPIETKPLSKIKRLTGVNLSRSWLNLPHVNYHDETDITETEAFRKSIAEEAKKREVRVTMLSFLLKAAAAALKEFPTFNSSMDPSGQSLILKNYYHIGVAVDTPDGLVVPVIRNVDQKNLFELSAELGEFSAKARAKKLMPGDMQGGCFTISSLGGIGGTGFAPIVNAPEVAILGVTRSKMAPVWNGTAFVPRLMLPLSLSYDHRVIDGAEGARFVTYLAGLVSDVRRLLL